MPVETQDSIRYRYYKSDVGCWIDGAFGIQHAAEKLSSMLSFARQGESETPSQAQERWLLVEDLDAFSSGNTDDEFIEETFDDATEFLQGVTADGLVWIWEAGDLILTTESQANNF